MGMNVAGNDTQAEVDAEIVGVRAPAGAEGGARGLNDPSGYVGIDRCLDRPEALRSRQLILDGERILLSSIVLFEWRRGPHELVSLFETATQIIRKGKSSKPTEFGRLIKIQDAETQIITDYEVCDQRPATPHC